MTNAGNQMLELVVKLLSLILISNLEERKKKHLTTEKLKSAYMACDGLNSMPEITKAAGYSSLTSVDTKLPLWEKEGLLISVGSVSNKRYLSLENVSRYVAHIQSQ